VGRVAEGIEPEIARAELDAVNRRLDEEHFGLTVEATMQMRPIRDEHLGAATAPALIALFASVVLLFLIACANVAGLGVARALTRGNELWIQRALGASGGTLLGELMLESAMIASAGCLLGLALAAGLLKLLPRLDPPHLPNLERVELDGTVWAFAVLAALSATLISGLAAAGSFSPAHRGRLRDGLIVGEVALAMVLLTGAGLCFPSFAALRRIDLGYETERVLSAIFIFPDSGYPELEDKRTLVRTVVDRVRSLPGVESAATVLLRPFEGDLVGWSSYLILQGQRVDGAAFAQNSEVNFEAVTPGYFETMGIPLLEGRDFTELDTDDFPRVAIVTRELAERLWPGERALGKRLSSSFGSRMFDENHELLLQTVVGVVEKASYRGLLTPYFDLYVPYRQSSPQPNNIVLRTAGEPEALASLLRDEIHALDPGIALAGVTTLDAIVEREFRPWRFNFQLFSFFGVTATLLAAVGLSGLLAAAVHERTREIGIRAAIGATPARLLRAFLAKGMALAGLGAIFGIAGSLLAARFMQSLLYGVEPSDSATLGIVTVVLLGTAFVASLLPAGRASRITPSAALRHP
jgi:putative ABC transport system permease protein